MTTGGREAEQPNNQRAHRNTGPGLLAAPTTVAILMYLVPGIGVASWLLSRKGWLLPTRRDHFYWLLTGVAFTLFWPLVLLAAGVNWLLGRLSW